MIPLYKPFMPPGVNLDEVLYSGELTYGKWGIEFEKRLGEFIGNPKVITTQSYNAAIQIVITLLGLKCGDEVIASPMSCLASNQPFITHGINVVWADISPYTGTLDPDNVRSKITKKTKAIVHNHFCGYPGYIDDICAIGTEYGIIVIDDAIEAFGSKINDKYIGNLQTPITIFSFQTVRLPNTIDGGAIVFHDNYLMSKAKLIRDYGIDRKLFRTEIGEINPEYDITLPGYGALMSEVNSFIGCKQMEQIHFLLEKQQNNASAWKKLIELDNKGDISLSPIPSSIPNYWIYSILAQNKLEAIERYRKLGFYASGVHLNNNKYSVFGKQELLLGVSNFFDKFIAVPSGWWVNM